MKYLSKLFAFSNNQKLETTTSINSLNSSTTLASTLYSVTFIAKPKQLYNKSDRQFDERQEKEEEGEEEEQEEEEEEYIAHEVEDNSTFGSQLDNSNQVTINTVNNSNQFEKDTNVIDRNKQLILNEKNTQTKNNKLGDYLLTATIGKTTVNTSSVFTSADNKVNKVAIKEDRLNINNSGKKIGEEVVINSHHYNLIEQLEIEEEGVRKREEEPTNNFAIDQQILLIEDDWILVNSNLSSNKFDNNNRSSSSNKGEPFISASSSNSNSYNNTAVSTKTNKHRQKHNSTSVENNKKSSINLNKNSIIIRQMALDKTDVELIKASWISARKDPVFSGVLLFKGLFTKFPEYLKFFPQFSDLDVENMRENKRLLRHAVKVIETVTFVVDSIGNESLADKLNQALQNLVRSHLKRNIGLNEFRNLGIVLIDFICEINNRRQNNKLLSQKQQKQSNEQCQLNKSSTGDSINQSSNDDSETMTSTLDKVRASSSPSSSSEDDNYLVGSSSSSGGIGRSINSNNPTDSDANSGFNRQQQQQQQEQHRDNLEANNDVDGSSTTKIDTNVLVAAWTKLYSSILDLVEHEEAQ